jgi:hypothetical protein
MRTTACLMVGLAVSLTACDESPSGNGADGTVDAGVDFAKPSADASSQEGPPADAAGEGTLADAATGDATSADAAPLGFTPYFATDFESYSPGTPLGQGNPFGTGGRSVASEDQAFSGKRSMKVEIKQGDKGGFGKWGASLNFTPTIKKGGEVWVRLRVYWPSSFKFTASPWMKFLRLHDRKGDGSNGGYNDLYIDNADSTTSVLRCIKETHDVWKVYNGPKIPRDTWETYEMYLFVGDLPVDKGGKARMRIWRDGALIFDRTDVPTISAASGEINLFYLFTYWNNENPPNNHAYIDDVVIATHASPPVKKDKAGNVFVGL